MNKVVLILFFFCNITYAQKRKYIEKDSCVNCIYLGLSKSEWIKKDAPYWRKIDSIAVISQKIYLGDLPSSMNSLTIGREEYYEIHIFHPSVDSMQIEKHYRIKSKRRSGFYIKDTGSRIGIK